jgi:hypothetical protein
MEVGRAAERTRGRQAERNLGGPLNQYAGRKLGHAVKRCAAGRTIKFSPRRVFL